MDLVDQIKDVIARFKLFAPRKRRKEKKYLENPVSNGSATSLGDSLHL